jgi:hypothetical protein
LPLSLFHPYSRLPADGATLNTEDEMCDPYEALCKTLVHVYETKCACCSGYGYSHRARRGRGHGRDSLITCLSCHGMGYVRHSTSRFYPSDPEKHLTLIRPDSKPVKPRVAEAIAKRRAELQAEDTQKAAKDASSISSSISSRQISA